MNTRELVEVTIALSGCVGAFVVILLGGLIKFYGLVSKIREEINILSKTIVNEHIIRLIVRDEVKKAVDIHEDKCVILKRSKED